MRTYLKILGGCVLLAAMTGLGTLAFSVPGREALYSEDQLASDSVYIAEPFPVEMLDKMEALLHSNMFRLQKPQMAALLYRYGRESGETYLADELLKRRSPTAAIVFALNRDEKRLDAILDVYRGLSLEEEIQHSLGLDPELTLALGRWDHPRVASALLAKQKLYPESGDIALALARLNVREAIPLLAPASAKASWKYSDDIELKVALAKLTPENPQRFAELVSRTYNAQEPDSPVFNEFAKYVVSEHISYAQDLRYIPVLIKEINAAYFIPKKVNGGLHHFAASELMNFSSDDAYVTMRKLFDKLPTRYETEETPFSSRMSVGWYLYQARPEGDHAFIQKALSQKNLEIIKTMHRLRDVHEGLLSFDVVLAHELED